jgi:hypothetical protein
MRFFLGSGMLVVAGLIVFTIVLMQQDVQQNSTYATVGKSYFLDAQGRTVQSMPASANIRSCNIEMSYTVGNKTYQLNDSHVMQGNAGCLAAGQRVKVFYIPKNPGDATMVMFTRIYFGILGVLGIMLAGLIMLYRFCKPLPRSSVFEDMLVSKT